MNQDIDVTPEEFSIIHDILREQLPRTARVWVFGSRVKHKTYRHSDIDIAIEHHDTLPALTLHKLQAAFTNSLLPYTVDIVDMHNIDDNFRDIINKEKVLFYQN